MTLQEAMKAIWDGAELCVHEANSLGPRTPNGKAAWAAGDRLLDVYRFMQQFEEKTND